jgi:hypothetical protein
MGRICTVCAHPRLSQINRDLVLDLGLRQTAQKYKQWGKVSIYALHRHLKSHISERARTAIIAGNQAAMDAIDVGALKATTEQRNLADLLHHREILEAEITRARMLCDFTALASLMGRMLQNIEQSSRLVGMLPTSTTTINLVTNAEDWPALQADLLTVARTVPAARKPLLELVYKRSHVSGIPKAILGGVATEVPGELG